jgi:hypothetical protein
MNYAQSFDEFASSLGPTDVALYAGAAVVLWILFKDRLNPVSVFIKSLFDKAKVSVVKATETPSKSTASGDVFFELVSSWKKTRDLAECAQCPEAVKVADQMFPFLSPNACKKEVV